MDDETTPSGIREDKLARAEARRKSRQKDHARRRHEGAKRQELIGGMTLGEFQKRFPNLPIKAWYQNRNAYCGESISGDEGFDDDMEPTIPTCSEDCPICALVKTDDPKILERLRIALFLNQPAQP
jgi:hypothetical protein